MINGRSYRHYHLKLRRGAVGAQEKFGLGSFVAFFSAKVLRGGPRALVQLTTCFVLLVLLLKLLPHRASYSVWRWQRQGAPNLTVDEDDGSVSGGLRIVVFGEKDVATPALPQDRGADGVDGRSWTEILCDELECTSYLSLVPTADDPSRVMTSTKLYATSVEQSMNLTFENYGPGLDFNFILDQFPIEWRVNDLSKQVDEFLAMKKPRHPPAETIWVLSFGTWDIWSLATEPLIVTRAIVDRMVDQIFLEVERLYESAMNETSIAWSDPNTAQPTSSRVSDGLPTPTPDPAKDRAWIKERDALEGHAAVEEARRDSGPDGTRHFRILIPRLFDPSLTPGWHDARPNTPAVHSKAEQVRNAAVLTEHWNGKLWTAMAEWIRSEERRKQDAKHLAEVQSESEGAVQSEPEVEVQPQSEAEAHPEHEVEVQPEPEVDVQLEPEVEVQPAAEDPPPAASDRETAVQIINEKIAAEKEHRKQRQRENAAVIGGQNHIPPSPRMRRRNASAEPEPEPEPTGSADGPGDREQGVDAGPRQLQRDGILYDLDKYLEEVIVQRQMQMSGLRDARDVGKLTEDGFMEVWAPCVGEVPEAEARTAGGRVNATEVVEETVDASGEGKGDMPPERNDPVIRGRPAPAPVASATPDPEKRNGSTEVSICDDPDEHLFYTGNTVTPRAVAAIARQAADMVRKNDSVRAGWADIHLPQLTWVGG